jgi:hypothetical protein
MRVEKREFPWGFSQLSCPGQTRTRVMRVDDNWEARVCMRVFSTLMPRSNENKSCMRVDESWEARVCIRIFSILMPRSNENKSCMRVVERREFPWEFLQLSCPGQTRTRVAWELMRVEKREFAWEFSQFSCPGQTRTRVAWELMRVDESWLDITACVAKTHINSYQNLSSRLMRIDKSR